VQANNKKILQRRGYIIKQAYSLAEARKIIEGEPPGAIVLDIHLPDGSGLDFLHELRKTSTVPVLMLTAMGTPQDIVRGLEVGGDDYLTKPYELPVFLMRVKALLRRASLIPEMISIGAIKIETSSNRAYMNNADMGLSQKEVSLLEQFIQNQGKAINAERLYEKVWGQKMVGDDGSLKNAISKLRKKLEGSGYTITASRGEGYCFEQQ